VTGTDVANLLCAVALISAAAAAVYRAWVRPPARTRVTVMPAELTAVEDEEFLADLTAHLKAYGAAVADYYDTEGTQ
jgi:hypothetical protein